MLPQVKKVLQASRVNEFFWKWTLDKEKDHTFDKKTVKNHERTNFLYSSIFWNPAAKFRDEVKSKLLHRTGAVGANFFAPHHTKVHLLQHWCNTHL